MAKDVPASAKICPLMSGRPIVTTVPTFVDSKQINQWSPFMVCCCREQCQWWQDEQCAIPKTLFQIAWSSSDVIEALRPLKALETPSLESGGSPLMRLAYAIEKLLTIVESKQLDKKGKPQ